jgi:transposase
MTTYKAVNGGGVVKRKNARNTSTDCHICGMRIPMPLSKRVFNCPNCGNVCHRDLNAANNINDRAGLARIYTPMDTRPLRREIPVASPMDEIGTICDQLKSTN